MLAAVSGLGRLYGGLSRFPWRTLSPPPPRPRPVDPIVLPPEVKKPVFDFQREDSWLRERPAPAPVAPPLAAELAPAPARPQASARPASKKLTQAGARVQKSLRLLKLKPLGSGPARALPHSAGGSAELDPASVEPAEAYEPASAAPAGLRPPSPASSPSGRRSMRAVSMGGGAAPAAPQASAPEPEPAEEPEGDSE